MLNKCADPSTCFILVSVASDNRIVLNIYSCIIYISVQPCFRNGNIDDAAVNRHTVVNKAAVNKHTVYVKTTGLNLCLDCGFHPCIQVFNCELVFVYPTDHVKRIYFSIFVQLNCGNEPLALPTSYEEENN